MNKESFLKENGKLSFSNFFSYVFDVRFIPDAENINNVWSMINTENYSDTENVSNVWNWPDIQMQ